MKSYPIFKFLITNLLFQLLLTANICGQAKTMSNKEIESIYAELDKLNAKLEKVIKSDPSLYDRMKVDLKKAQEIKDPQKQIEFLLSYKKKYFEQYSSRFQKSGINMKEVIASLNRKYPSYFFKESNNFGVVFNPRSNPRFTYKKGNWSLPLNQLKKISDFQEQSNEECVLASGSQVTFGDKSIDALAESAIAGLCGANGSLTANIEMPSSARTKTLRIEGKLEAHSAALGIGGAARSYSAAGLSVRADNNQTLTHEISEFVYSFLLWYVNESEFDDFSHTIDVSSYNNIKINGESGVEIMSIVGGAARANGKLKFDTVELKYASN